jgi:hypothetical protein
MAETLEKFVTEWGFCSHYIKPSSDNGLCEDCQGDPSQRSYSMGDLLTLNHERQVAIFGWCACEDYPKTYEDCPQ